MANSHSDILLVLLVSSVGYGLIEQPLHLESFLLVFEVDEHIIAATVDAGAAFDRPDAPVEEVGGLGVLDSVLVVVAICELE